MKNNVSLISKLKERASHLKSETITLYLAARHPGTPWYAKLFVAAVVAYALSPIDLIPDFIPVFGYLDDIILIPIAITLAIKMIPAPILDECRMRAQDVIANGKPVSRIAGVIIVSIWVGLAMLCFVWFYRLVSHSQAT